MKKAFGLPIVLATFLYSPAMAAQCGGVTISGALGGDCKDNSANPIFALINTLIAYATGALGLVLVLMIVLAGFEYVISGGNPEKAKGAKRRIEYAATGFVMFVVMWAALQFLLPGSVFK